MAMTTIQCNFPWRESLSLAIWPKDRIRKYPQRHFTQFLTRKKSSISDSQYHRIRAATRRRRKSEILSQREELVSSNRYHRRTKLQPSMKWTSLSSWMARWWSLKMEGIRSTSELWNHPSTNQPSAGRNIATIHLLKVLRSNQEVQFWEAMKTLRPSTIRTSRYQGMEVTLEVPRWINSSKTRSSQFSLQENSNQMRQCVGRASWTRHWVM